MFNEIKETEINWVGSFLIPVLIAIAGAVISFVLNRKKTRAEIKTLQVNTKKSKVEIKKLHLENEQIKSSFQPVVLSALQTVQEKVISDKINGLKVLISLKSDLIQWEYEDVEGDAYMPVGDNYYRSIYHHFTKKKVDDYINFHQEYAFLYSKDVFEVLNNLLSEIKNLMEDIVHASNFTEPDNTFNVSVTEIKSIINLYDTSIKLVRSDCFLDSDFIHRFMDKYKI